MPRFLHSFRTSTSGDSHWMTTFLGSGMQHGGAAGLYTTRWVCWPYGNQRSMKICCGLDGMGGKRSTTTFRAGGGTTLPGTCTNLPGIGHGGGGGASRRTTGGGVLGFGGAWRTTKAGAGATCLCGSCWITMSPAFGGGGGFKYLQTHAINTPTLVITAGAALTYLTATCCK